MRNLHRTCIFTAIPIVILSLVSLFSKQPDLNKGLVIAWLIAGDIWLIALLTAFGFYIKKSKELARWILAGAKENLHREIEIHKECGADGWLKKAEGELAKM